MARRNKETEHSFHHGRRHRLVQERLEDVFADE